VIALAQQKLGWQPKVSLEQRPDPTIFWFKKLL
jgi:nucleoside-diphosphate-sugar epimerase